MTPNSPKRRSRLVDKARRPYDALAEKLAEVVRQGERTESKVDALREEVDRTYVVPSADRRGVGSLSDPVAEFMNWATGAQGYAAQSGLWFTPSVSLVYRQGEVEVAGVSARIVEIPWIYATLAPRVAPGRRILDIGGGGSLVGLSLASLGYKMTIVDPRGVPIEHPNLKVHRCRVDELDSAERDFDAVIALSSVEHFGRGHHGEEGGAPRLDINALGDARSRCNPGATLALTVPFGSPSVSEFQRVYDEEGVQELTSGWDQLELRIYVLEGSGGRVVSSPQEWEAVHRDFIAGKTTWRARASDDGGGLRGVGLYAGELP